MKLCIKKIAFGDLSVRNGWTLNTLILKITRNRIKNCVVCILEKKEKKIRICNVLVIGTLKFSIGTLIARDKQSLDTVFIR